MTKISDKKYLPALWSLVVLRKWECVIFRNITILQPMISVVKPLDIIWVATGLRWNRCATSLIIDIPIKYPMRLETIIRIVEMLNRILSAMQINVTISSVSGVSRRLSIIPERRLIYVMTIWSAAKAWMMIECFNCLIIMRAKLNKFCWNAKS